MNYCSNCMISMTADDEATKVHYKSEWHRYNIKRRLLNLQPVDEETYQKKFLQQQTMQKEVFVSNQAIHFCKLCNKSFNTNKTYEQHIQSSKHRAEYKQSLRSLKTPTSEIQSDKISVASKCSLEGPNICLFCDIEYPNTNECCLHMQSSHGFFIREMDCCVDLEGLLKALSEQINTNQTCLHCYDSFKCPSAVKQHMVDRGHCFMPQQEYKVLSQHYDFEEKLQTLIDQQKKLYSIELKPKEALTGEESTLVAVQEEWQDEESEKDSEDDDDEDVPVTLDDKYKKLKQQLKELRSFKAILTKTGEMQLPNGKILGSRLLRKYYKQNHIPFPVDQEDKKMLENAKNEYLRLSDETGLMVFNKEFFTKFLKHQFSAIQEKKQHLELRIGLRSNSITRKHYRSSN